MNSNDCARRDKEQAQYLKQRLIEFFTEHDLKKVETRRYTLSRRRSGGKQRLILHLEPEALPTDFQRISIEADTEAIRDALTNGEDLGFAQLGVRKEYIHIR